MTSPPPEPPDEPPELPPALPPDPPALSVPLALSPGAAVCDGVGVGVEVESGVLDVDGRAKVGSDGGPATTVLVVSCTAANAPVPATSKAATEAATITAALRVIRRLVGAGWSFCFMVKPPIRVPPACTIRVSLNQIVS